MLLFNAVVLSVIVMLVLSIARVHVVISLFVASLVGGLVAGMGMSGTMVAFQDGLAGRPLGVASPPGQLDHQEAAQRRRF